MTDVYLEWNGDFQIDNLGDLLTVDGDVETRQRLERRLFTAVKGYVWHPEYGAGLPQKIGSVFSIAEITAIVNAQVAMEESVAPNPPPIVVVQASPNDPSNIGIAIKYVHARTGETISLTITP